MKKQALFYLFIALFTFTQSLFNMEIESLNFNKEEERNLHIIGGKGDRSNREILLSYDESHRRYQKERPGLVYAASIGATNIVHGLLLLDLNPNEATPDTYGATPLVEAAVWGRFDSATLLLTFGADIFQATSRGHTPRRSASSVFLPHNLNPNDSAYIHSQRLLIVHLFQWWQHVQRQEDTETIQQFKTWLQNASNRQTLKHWFSIIQNTSLNYNVISNLIDWWTETKKHTINDASFHAWIAVPGNMKRLHEWMSSDDRKQEEYPISCEQREDGTWYAALVLPAPRSAAAAAAADFE